MKLVFAASVLANIALAYLLLRGPRTAAPESQSASGTASGSAVVAAAVKSEASPEVVTNTVVRKITWEQVESPDYREYIANLRSIGCPDETIRDIILADVNKLYDSKRKQLQGPRKKFEFWKAGNPMMGFVGDPEMMKKNRELSEEKSKVLKGLGIQPDALTEMISAAGGNPMETMFDFLSDSKRADVMKLMTDFQSKMVEESGGGVAIDGDTMMKNQRAMEDELQKMLTPEEFTDYQLRFSMTANTLRQGVRGFDPSEEEFMKVFRLKEAFDKEHSPFGLQNPTEEQQRKRMEAEEVLKKELRASLGDQRYQDYERAQDYTYQQMYNSMKKSDVAPAVVNEVYAMKQAAERQAVEVQGNGNLSPEQRDAALRAIRAETVRSMEQTMGSEAWETYNRPNNTWWLRNIAPETTPPPPVP